jgi:hypothetical protein
MNNFSADIIKFGYLIAVLVLIITVCAIILFRKDDGTPIGLVRLFRRIKAKFGR